MIASIIIITSSIIIIIIIIIIMFIMVAIYMCIYIYIYIYIHTHARHGARGVAVSGSGRRAAAEVRASSCTGVAMFGNEQHEEKHYALFARKTGIGGEVRHGVTSGVSCETSKQWNVTPRPIRWNGQFPSEPAEAASSSPQHMSSTLTHPLLPHAVCSLISTGSTKSGRSARSAAREGAAAVCVYVCMYVCTYVRTYIRTYVRTYVRMYVCVCIYRERET